MVLLLTNVIQMHDAQIQQAATSAPVMSQVSLAMVETVTIMIRVGIVRVMITRNVSKIQTKSLITDVHAFLHLLVMAKMLVIVPKAISKTRRELVSM